MDPAHPTDSATVIVLRDAGALSEVLLFPAPYPERAFGGAHVFPGGVVDAADAAPSPARTRSTSHEMRPPHAWTSRSRAPGEHWRFWSAGQGEIVREAGSFRATRRRQDAGLSRSRMRRSRQPASAAAALDRLVRACAAHLRERWSEWRAGGARGRIGGIANSAGDVRATEARLRIWRWDQSTSLRAPASRRTITVADQ